MNPNAENQTPIQKKTLSNGIIALIVIGIIVGLCFICGIIGMFIPKPQELDQNTQKNTAKIENTNVAKVENTNAVKSENTNITENKATNNISVNSSINSNVSPNSNTNITPQQETNLFINIPDLANKSPQDLDKLIGKPIQIIPITSTPEQMPGEFRRYDIKEMKDALQIRFYKGKAVSFNMIVPKEKQTKTPEELAELCGFKVSGATGEQVSQVAKRWKGKFGDVTFEEVIALKTLNDNYQTLTAKITK